MLARIQLTFFSSFMALSSAFLASASISPSAFAQTYAVVSAEDASKLIELNRNNSEFVLLDVRTAEEYAEAHINQSLHIDFYASDFKDQIAKLDKSKQYLLYCRSGNRSSKTAQLMISLGFTQLSEIKGGIIAWKAAKLPTVSGK